MKEELTREYIIPLRREWQKKANYRRTGRAVKFIKQFIAKHMKVSERDVSKVKLDPYFNNEIWFRGRANPPSKIKVRATKVGDIVKVTLAETTDKIKFDTAKHERKHKVSEKKSPEKAEEKKEEKTDEQKKEEKEKEQSVAVANEMIAEQKAKEVKHTPISKEKNIPQQRKVLDRH